MAKKKAAPSLCEQGGGEIQAMGLRVKANDIIDVSTFICNTAALIRVTLTDAAGNDQRLIDQVGASQASATLPVLGPGFHTLVWSYINASSPWQTRTQVVVNGTTRFLQRKSSDGNNPFLRGFLSLEVVP